MRFTLWDGATITGALLLAAAAWWIYPPASVIVLAAELLTLGILMDAKAGRK